MAEAAGEDPAMSVVVFAYNNEATIQAAVLSLVDQESQEPFELIVVCSGGDDSSRVVRENFPDIELISFQRRLLPGAARNEGVRRANGEFIAFLEGHGTAAPGWIERRLEDHRAGHRAVAGAIDYGGPRSLIGLASHYLIYSNRVPGRPPGIVVAPDSAAHSVSFDREVLDAAGPFNEAVRVSEDTDMSLRLDEMGMTILFDPKVVTSLARPTTFIGMVADHYRRGGRASRQRGLVWPEIGIPALVGRTAVRAVIHLRWRVFRVRAYGGESALRILALMPFLTAGLLAERMGWLVEQIRRRRHLRTEARDLG